LRRLGHKIAIEALELDDYRRVFEGACKAEGIAHDAQAFDRLITHYHQGLGRPMLACYPRDLLHLIVSRARYMGIQAELSPELLDWAWHAYFGNEALIEEATETNRGRP